MIGIEERDQYLAKLPAGNPPTPGSAPNTGFFDMQAYIDQQERFRTLQPKPWREGTLWQLEECPFDPDHGGDSALTQSTDGKPGFNCFHNGCQDKTIKDVFALFPPVRIPRHISNTSRKPSPGLGTGAVPKAVPEPLLDGYTLYGTSYPPPVFLFADLLANGLTILAGRPKSGKSWLTLQMAITAAKGNLLFGKFSSTGATNVLYCGLEESPARTHNRLKKLLPENDIQLQNIDFRYTLKSLAEGGAAELDELLSDKGYGLIVIDTFLRMANAGASGSQNVMRTEYKEIAVLQELSQRHKCAIVLVHHTRKAAAENSLDAVAGTTGITAACDAVWTLRKLLGGECVLDVTGREMEEQTLGLRLETGDGFGWQLTGQGEEVGMSEARQEIVELLKDDAPLTPAQIAVRLRKNAVTIRRLLQKMAAADVVRKDRSGKYYLTSQREQGERENTA